LFHSEGWITGLARGSPTPSQRGGGAAYSKVVVSILKETMKIVRMLGISGKINLGGGTEMAIVT